MTPAEKAAAKLEEERVLAQALDPKFVQSLLTAGSKTDSKPLPRLEAEMDHLQLDRKSSHFPDLEVERDHLQWDRKSAPQAGATLALKGFLDVKAPTGPSLSAESRALNGPLEKLLAFPTDSEATGKALNAKDFRAFQDNVYNSLEESGRVGTAVMLTEQFAKSLANDVATLPAPTRAAFSTLLLRRLENIDPRRIWNDATPHLSSMLRATLRVTPQEAKQAAVLVAVRDLAANTSWLHGGDFDKQARHALLRAGVDASQLGSAIPLLAETLGLPPVG